MLQNVTRIDWKDCSEAIPVFLILVGIPFSYSIADGMAPGFISHPIVKLFSGRRKDAGWLHWLLAAILTAYFLSIRSRMG